MKYSVHFFCSIALVLIVTACTTSIPVQVNKLPTIDTSSITRLAVKPFDTFYLSLVQRQVAGELTRIISEIILNTRRFVLVDGPELSRLERTKERYDTVADAFFTGEINELSVQDTIDYYKHENKDGTVEKRPIYKRTVILRFTYRLVRTGDDVVIHQRTKSGSAEDSNYHSRMNLKSIVYLSTAIIKRELKYLNRDIAPWTTTEQRILAKETSKDKSLKDRMRKAETMVKRGNYRYALTAYQEIYEDTHSFAAAYNAALITEVLGDIAQAIDLMQELAHETGNIKAALEADRMRQTLAEIQALDAKYAH